MAAKRFIVIVNPSGGSGRGTALLEKVRPVFAAAAELDVHVTTCPGHAEELAKTLDLGDCDGLCIIGGDGTIHETVGGLLHRGAPVSIPLGVIPGGTGNTVAAHLGCTDPLEAARRVIVGKTQSLDVIRATMGGEVAYCVNIVGWGSAVEINRTAERLRIFGSSRYAMAAICNILWARRRRVRLILDSQVIEDEFLMIVACNTKFTGKGMRLAPNAEIDDGKIDVVFVRRASRIEMVNVFRKVYDGSHLSLPCVEHRQVRSFAIESDRADPLNVDGELKGTTPVSGEIIPAALRIFC